MISCLHSGQEPNDQVVDGMMSEAPGPLNFTMFLTLFGEKLTGMLCTTGQHYHDHIWSLSNVHVQCHVHVYT